MSDRRWLSAATREPLSDNSDLRGDFIGDRECVTHHACDCMKRKAAERDELLEAIRLTRGDSGRDRDQALMRLYDLAARIGGTGSG